MAKEIEYKFLLKQVPNISRDTVVEEIVQGYMAESNGVTVRVRIIEMKSNDRSMSFYKEAYITVKGKQVGLTRDEFEYMVPLEDAEQMLALCKGKIEKTRYNIMHDGHNIELDVFGGLFEGLVIAEVEVDSEDVKVTLPESFGEAVDVSKDFRYTNASIVKYGIPRNENL